MLLLAKHGHESINLMMNSVAGKKEDIISSNGTHIMKLKLYNISNYTYIIYSRNVNVHNGLKLI